MLDFLYGNKKTNILLTLQNLCFLTLTSVLLLSPETSVSCCTASNSCWTPVADFLSTPPPPLQPCTHVRVPDTSSLSSPQNQRFTRPQQKCLLCPRPGLSRERRAKRERLCFPPLSCHVSSQPVGPLRRSLERRRRNSFHLTPSLRPRSFAS